MIKSYLTNAICPRCGGRLMTQDYVSDYPLCCPACEEDFYFIENASYTFDNPNPYFEVSIPMDIDVYTKNIEYIKSILPNISFLGFDDSDVTDDNRTGICDIGWDDYSFLIGLSEKIMPKIRNVGRIKQGKYSSCT